MMLLDILGALLLGLLGGSAFGALMSLVYDATER